MTLQLVLGGTFAGGSLGEERLVAPGELIIFDMTQPQRTRLDGAHTLTVSLGREQVDPLVSGIRRFHGAIVPVDRAGLVGDFMVALARRAGTVAPSVAAAATGVFGALLAAALDGVTPSPDPERHVPLSRLVRKERAKAYVAGHFADPSLTVDHAIRALGLSRSSLNRAFEPEGGFSRYVLRYRLYRLRATLRLLGETRRIAVLAHLHGLGSESHCNRAFKAAFGLPPGEYRARVWRRRAEELTGRADGVITFAAWHDEIT